MSELLMKDPIYHGFSSDALPDNHPRANESIDCVECGKTVHAFNNETCADWFETGIGAVCFDCYAKAVAAFDTDRLAILEARK